MWANPSESKIVQAFLADCGARWESVEKTQHLTVIGKSGWLFFGPELRHLIVGRFWGADAAKISRATRPEYSDPLPAILDFKSQLDKAQIELLLVPVPPKAAIYPDMLSDTVSEREVSPSLRLDLQHQVFYELLLRRGVTVLDLAPEFLVRRSDKNGPLYCKQDTHWSGNGCVLAARQIADRVRNREWMRGFKKLDLVSEWKKIEITGDLLKSLGDSARPKENLLLRFVGTRSGAGLRPVEPERASPIILLGDSHGLIFHAGDDMLARGAGLADQLALELGLAVDVVAVRGSGATPARINLMRRARADPSYLEKKKLVIWCFSTREFTESSGWQKVPIVRQP